MLMDHSHTDTASSVGERIGAGLITLVLLGGIGFLLFIALFSA